MISYIYPKPLIQLIEYDWALVARCRVCGHTARGGANELVNRFRDNLRATDEQVSAALADHCGSRPIVYSVQGAGMDLWTLGTHSDARDWAYRDQRLRTFLVRHALPLDLADERKEVADAWLAEFSPKSSLASSDNPARADVPERH
jgi:hypothetical protein